MKNSPTEGIHPAYNRPPSPLEVEVARRLHLEKKPIPIELHFAFGRHASASDVAVMQLPEKIKAADIILLEGAGTTELDVGKVEQVARGTLPPHEATGDPFYGAIFKLFYQSRKAVAFLDLRYGDQIKDLLSSEYNERSHLFNEILERRLPWKQVRERVNLSCVHTAVLQKEREDKVLAMFSPTISKLVKANPLLKKKRPLVVLAVWGVSHTRLYQEIKRHQHPNATRFFTPLRYTFSPPEEVMRMQIFGKPVGERELRRVALFELFSYGYLVNPKAGPENPIAPFLSRGNPEDVARKIVNAAYPDFELLYKLLVEDRQYELAYSKIREIGKKVFPDSTAP